MPSTLLLSGFFLIHSIITKTALDPSKAGKGSKLKTARFTPINAEMFSKLQNPPVFMAFAVTPMVVTVPPKEPIPRLPVNSCLKTVKTVPASLNEY